MCLGEIFREKMRTTEWPTLRQPVSVSRNSETGSLSSVHRDISKIPFSARFRAEQPTPSRSYFGVTVYSKETLRSLMNAWRLLMPNADLSSDFRRHLARAYTCTSAVWVEALRRQTPCQKPSCGPSWVCCFRNAFSIRAACAL